MSTYVSVLTFESVGGTSLRISFEDTLIELINPGNTLVINMGQLGFIRG